jgi:hypothetical protein
VVKNSSIKNPVPSVRALYQPALTPIQKISSYFFLILEKRKPARQAVRSSAGGVCGVDSEKARPEPA